MDVNNYETIIALAKTDEAKNKVKLLLDVLFPDEKVDVPDPYTGSIFQFEQVFKIIDKATTKIAQQINNE